MSAETDPTGSGSGGGVIALGFAGLGVSRGDHIAHFYRTRDEWADVALPFLITGLQAGDKCIYLMGSAGEVRSLRRQLEAQGVNVGGAISRNQLSLREASSDPHELRRWFEDLGTEIPSRFPGVRWGGDMSWSLRKMPSIERLMELESNCNCAKDRPGVFLCQYPLKSFMGNAIMDAWHTHPLCIVGRTIHRSPLYLDPEVFKAGLRDRESAARRH
jgi:hypothetical protein